VFELDKADYVYDDTTNTLIQGGVRTKLFVSATVDKDGVVKIDAPILNKIPNPAELLNAAIIAARKQADQDTTFNNPDNEGNESNFIELQEVNTGVGIGLIAVDTSEDLVEIAAGGGIGLVKKKDLAQGAGGNNDADGNQVEEVRDAFLKIIRLLGLSLFDMYGQAFQPVFAYIPTRSRTLRYGPAFPSGTNLNSQGKLEIVQDDGYAPWEFGSISFMQQALQFKVDNSASNQKTLQSASVVVEGFPEFSIGNSLGRNSNINSIGISFGTDGVRTTYQLQSFTKKFGELTKEEIASRLLTQTNVDRRTQMTNQTGFNQSHMTNVNKNIGGRGTVSQKIGTKGGARDFG